MPKFAGRIGGGGLETWEAPTALDSTACRLGNGHWPLRERDLLQFGEVALLVEAANDPSALEMVASSRTREDGLAAISRIPLGPRKLRLLASACCRSKWKSVSPAGVLLAERYVAGLASKEEFETIFMDGHYLLSEVLAQAVLSEALDVAERYADGLGSEEGLASARRRFDSLATDDGLESDRRTPSLRASQWRKSPSHPTR